MVYTLAVHVPIVGLSLLPVRAGLPLVLASLHIAFLELVIDPVCTIVFEALKEDAVLMAQAPRPCAQPLLSAADVALALLHGGMLTSVLAGLYVALLALGRAGGQARTAVFIAQVTANAVLVLPSRHASPR